MQFLEKNSKKWYIRFRYREYSKSPPDLWDPPPQCDLTLLTLLVLLFVSRSIPPPDYKNPTTVDISIIPGKRDVYWISFGIPFWISVCCFCTRTVTWLFKTTFHSLYQYGHMWHKRPRNRKNVIGNIVRIKKIVRNRKKIYFRTKRWGLSNAINNWNSIWEMEPKTKIEPPDWHPPTPGYWEVSVHHHYVFHIHNFLTRWFFLDPLKGWLTTHNLKSLRVRWVGLLR